MLNHIVCISQDAEGQSTAVVRQAGSDCRATNQKKSTRDRVACDDNLLASGITPAYQADNDRAYSNAVRSLKTFDIIADVSLPLLHSG